MTIYTENRKNRRRNEVFVPSLRHFVSFHSTPSIVTGALQALLGITRTEARRRRKFIKYLKVRKRLLSPVAINFHLHFIFVSFVTLENRVVYERTMGQRKKKLQKEKGRRKVTEMPEGHIEESLDDGRQLLCA